MTTGTEVTLARHTTAAPTSVGGGLLATILALFILSGAAGLIYEVVWARQLVLVFGNTTQAVSAILTGYFGGLAIGSFLGGRVADRVASPLRMYGVLEIVLVVVVLITPLSFDLIHEVYRGAYSSFEGAPGALALVRFVLAILALAPATILMGATLPALTRYLTRGEAHLSGAFGRLYAANTAGAILGTLAAGLVLIEVFGLAGALLVGALCSGLAGLLALVLSVRRSSVAPPAVPAEPDPDDARLGATGRPARVGLALGVAFVSGLTSLGYQVLWTRLLASGSGNSTYVFTMILAVFLLGIALGAVVFTIIRPRLRDPIAFLAGTQVAVALIVIVGLVFVIARPPLLDPGRPLEAVFGVAMSVLVVVLPATLVMGIAFPASSALLPRGAAGAGGQAGRLLAVNTAGAIVGSFVIPFFVVPSLGSPHAVVLLVVVNIATAIALALGGGLADRVMGIRIAGVAVLALVVVGLALVRPGMVVDPTVTRISAVDGDIFASTEDEIAAVHAGQLGQTPQLWVAGTSMTVLTIDANLMPILPLMARPDAETALVVAFGMGSSFRTALVAGLDTDAVELVPSVPGMFGYFHDDAGQVFANPKGRVIIADGRNHLELTDERYDIVVTDPPPPIESSGASVISSLEYYEAGRAKLTDDGIMMQWVPYGPGAGDILAHIRTFVRVFPEVRVLVGPGGHGVFMLGSMTPFSLEESAIREVLGRPGILENLSEPFDAPADTADEWIEEIAGLNYIAPEQAPAAAGDGPLVTDDRPFSEYFLLRRGLPQ